MNAIASVVRVKPGVAFAVIAPAGFEILRALASLTWHMDRDIVITSGTDFHQLPDPHARGEAYDVSVAGFSDALVVKFYWSCKAYLSDAFTVLFEVPVLPANAALREICTVNPKATAPHIHLQLKNGVQYPPPADAPAPTRSA